MPNTLPAPPPAPDTALSPRRLSATVALFVIALLIVTWSAVGAIIHQKRADEIASEKRQNANLANVLAEQTLRVLASVDQAALRARDAVAAGGTGPDLVRFANETGLAPKILVQLSLIGPDGHFVGSNLDPDGQKNGHIDLSSREHVRVHLGAPAGASSPGTAASAAAEAATAAVPLSNGLFIGKPVLGKVSHQWTIQLSRKVVDANGRTLGVIVASVDPTYFEDVYRSVALGRAGSVALIGDDLAIRARIMDNKAVGMGTRVAGTSAFALHNSDDQAIYISSSSVDQVERIFATRRAGGYPLHVVVGSSVDAALAGWRTTSLVMVALTALLTVAIIVASINFVNGLRRLERTNEALRASEAAANASSEAKSAFLAAVSHELRTPLTSIRGFSELMEHRLESPKWREQAGLIRKASEHLNQLLTDILDMTKVEAGAMTLSPEPQDIRAVSQGTADFFALTAADKGLTLTTRVAEDAPTTFGCDGLRLKQILNNLLSNAVKFTPSGGVVLSVERTGTTVKFHVDDTGPGVPPALRDAIFQKFRQGSARVSFEHGGTGLGLALSRSLAELMAGSLTLDPREGPGSRFTLELPLVPRAGAVGALRS
jgi:signal transduction histidine kinase